MDDPLDAALGLPALPREEKVIVVPDQESEDQDYEFARKNLYALAQKAEDSVDQLSEIADISQHPRAYEVLSGLIKTAVEANKELLNLKKTAKDINGGVAGGPQTVNNTLVMTSDEVLAMLKGHSK